MDQNKGHFPRADVNCPQCEGYGYAVFSVNREPGLEIQRDDGCDCLDKRLGIEPGSAGAGDDEAEHALLLDLVERDPGALRALFELMDFGPAKPTIQPDPLRELVSAAREIAYPDSNNRASLWRLRRALEHFEDLEV